MKFKTPKNFSQNIYTLLRRSGYMPIHDRRTGKDSFVRKLSSGHYPRFHLYLSEIGREIVFDLHLDQSKNLYSGQKAHNADYDSQEVKDELIRIYQTIKGFIITDNNSSSSTPEYNEASAGKSQEKNTKKSWLKRLFG